MSFPTWPYDGTKVIVLSKTLKDIPEHLVGSVSVQSSLDSLLVYLENKAAKHIYIDGGEVIQSFLKAGLVSELIITTIPVLLGGGITLFERLEQDIHLTLVEYKQFENSFVQ